MKRSAYGATEAARAAGRAYVLAPDIATAQARAYAAARIAMDDQGVALDAGDGLIVCRPTPQSCLQPGLGVEVRLDLDVSLPLLPFVHGRALASIAVASSHFEPYGFYSSYPGLQARVVVRGHTVSVDLSMPFRLPVAVSGVAATTTIHASALSVMPIY